MLAIAAGAVGVVCFLILYRPRGGLELLGALAAFLPGALLQPLVLIAALAALGFALAARYFELRSHAAVMPSARAYAIDVEPPMDERTPAVEPALLGGFGPRPFEQRLKRHLQGSADMISFVDELLGEAIQQGASDVHIQPVDVASRISFRVGGVLERIADIPPALHEPLIRRLKVLAKLISYERERPQDGHFTVHTARDPVDVRVSLVPTHHGEKAVLRLARSLIGLRALADLGMPEPMAEALAELLARPEGLIVLTGPTGSGKTTTLYAALAHIQRQRGRTTNIATIEDPIELDLPFLSQTEVQRTRGLGFVDGLRAILRQDPDVLLVGEIRDTETAHTAIQAAMTGHLILTTLHADAAAGVFNRLIDLGGEPYIVASACVACLSQRLVRGLCPYCRRAERIAPEVAARLARRGVRTEGKTFYRAAGCERCSDSGYAGRTPVFELLPVSPDLRDLIGAGTPTHQIEEAAMLAGMTTLLEAAVEQAATGAISLEEALRVTGG